MGIVVENCWNEHLLNSWLTTGESLTSMHTWAGIMPGIMPIKCRIGIMPALYWAQHCKKLIWVFFFSSLVSLKDMFELKTSSTLNFKLPMV